MVRAMKTQIIVLMVVLAGVGCVTTQSRRLEQTHRAQDLEALKADVYRLKEQSSTAVSGYEQMYADIDRLRRESTKGDQSLAEKLDQLERRLRNQERALDAMPKQIVAELSRKMASVLQSQAPRGSQYGREHVVQSGETLSEIAAAYGATVKMVVRANGLKNANAIRAGQKLFIPE